MIVIIFRLSHVIKQHHWWKSQAESILGGRIVIKESTCFSITMMLFLMSLKTRKSTSSIKKFIFEQVSTSFLSQIWLSLKKTISTIMDIVSRFFETLGDWGCWNDFSPKPLSTCTTNIPVYYDIMQFSVNIVYNEWTLSNLSWFGLFIQLYGTRVKV